jgi:hypothetical protein
MDPIVEDNGKNHLTDCFHLPLAKETMLMPEFVLRYQGRWFVVNPRPYEPERMTTDVAWMQLKENVSAEEAYRRWYEKQRRISRLFQQCTGLSRPSSS